MPERLSYDEAMLFSQIRLKIQDPELKQGKVEMLTIQTQQGNLERPWGIEGGFAVVYKFRTTSGNLRALRCFRVPISDDTRMRYERIGPYFQQYIENITAHFQYHEQGILVKEPPSSTIYPIIVMDWIEGVTLLDKVDELCQKQDQQGLQKLGEHWLSILRALNDANIAHGDLAALNAMVRPDGTIVLIDYDGVYIPDFAGLPQRVIGQIDYQHHDMAHRPFNEHMDAFSALVIYTALLALAAQPNLWHTYAARDSQNKLLDTNLLWKQKDFQDVDQSALFQDLEQIQDQQLQLFVRELKMACKMPVAQARFPFHIVDPSYNLNTTFRRLVHAIQANNNEQILQAWQPALENYGPAQPYLARIQQAQQYQLASQQLISALQSKDLVLIAHAYQQMEQKSWQHTLDQQARLHGKIALNFIQAYDDNKDDALLAAYHVLQRRQYRAVFNRLTSDQEQHIHVAEKRQKSIQNFHDALKGQDVHGIAHAYQQLEQASWHTLLAQSDLLQGKIALHFARAYDQDNDEALLAAYTSFQRIQTTTLILLTPQQQLRVHIAQERTLALQRLRQALNKREIRQIASTYDDILEVSMEITVQEREQAHLAKTFTHAYSDDDDIALNAAWMAIQASTHKTFFHFTREEQERITLTRIRLDALAELRQALASQEIQNIADAYKQCRNCMKPHKFLTDPELEQARLAYIFIKHFQDDERILKVYDTIQDSGYTLRFSTRHRERIEQLARRRQVKQDFTDATGRTDKNAQEISDTYLRLQQYAGIAITPSQERLVAQAKQALRMRDIVRNALQHDDDRGILDHYDQPLAQQFVALFTKKEQLYITGVLQEQTIEQAYRKRDYAQVISLLRASPPLPRLQTQSWLLTAMQRLLSKHDLFLEKACIVPRFPHNQLAISWRWPEIADIHYIILFWSPDQEHITPDGFLRHPQKRSALRAIPSYKIVEKQRYESIGKTEIDIATHTYMHLEICAAMYDDWNGNIDNEIWCFSRVTRCFAQICNNTTLRRLSY